MKQGPGALGLPALSLAGEATKRGRGKAELFSLNNYCDHFIGRR